MKKLFILISCLAITVVVFAAGSGEKLTQREVRDPIRLQNWIESSSVFTNSLSAGEFQILNSTQLVFLTSGSVTNVLDVDITTP